MQILVGTRKGLFQLDRGQTRWTVTRASFLGDPISMAARDPLSGALYAGLDTGHFGAKLFRSDDDGVSWRELPCPAFDKDEPPIKEGGKSPSVKAIWSLETGGPDQPGRLWCGTTPGGLFRSDDGGESWSLMRGLWEQPTHAEWGGAGDDVPALHTILVDPRDSGAVLVAISTGGVFRTTDDGASWQSIGKGMYSEYETPNRRMLPHVQDVHRLSRCRAAPDVIWCQHHNGAFRSVDGGDTWTEIHPQPSKFGFAVVAHPQDPATAWYVPAIKDEKRYPVDAKVVVARTGDGGASFDVLRNGLPQEHAYDLVFRHGLDIGPEGSVLAFGSSTGSLWVTDDGGEKWRTVSKHLPPIYCVRVV